MEINRYKKYAPLIARTGVGIVFLVFGIWQILNPQNWLGYLPDFALNLGMSPNLLILFNGIFDLILGVALSFGLFVRIFSLIGIIHLSGIIFTLGFTDIAVRDVGLLIVLISVFLHGKDDWCLR